MDFFEKFRAENLAIRHIPFDETRNGRLFGTAALDATDPRYDTARKHVDRNYSLVLSFSLAPSEYKSREKILEAG